MGNMPHSETRDMPLPPGEYMHVQDTTLKRAAPALGIAFEEAARTLFNGNGDGTAIESSLREETS
jgi:hypothetical protein